MLRVSRRWLVLGAVTLRALATAVGRRGTTRAARVDRIVVRAVR